jgi:hypothetical protein
LHHAESIRQLAAKVLISSKGEKTCVNRPVRLVRLRIVPAIAGAKLFNPLDDRPAAIFVLQAGRSSDARKATEMYEIQMLSVAEAPHVRPIFSGRIGLKRSQRINAKNRVIEIASTGAIGEAPVRVELSKQKVVDEAGRISVDFGCEPSHLEHL